MACIESAIGLLNLRDIASSSTKYPVKGLVFAAEDYCADTGILRTPSSKELLYARQKVVATACAFGLEAIDMVCVDYKDPSILVI